MIGASRTSFAELRTARAPHLKQRIDPSQLFTTEVVLTAPVVTNIKQVLLALSREDWPTGPVVTVRIERLTPATDGQWSTASVTLAGGVQTHEDGTPMTDSVIALGRQIRPGGVRVRITPLQPFRSSVRWMLNDGSAG